MALMCQIGYNRLAFFVGRREFRDLAPRPCPAARGSEGHHQAAARRPKI